MIATLIVEQVSTARVAARGALGFRRLSIIDVEGARQPMQNEDASVTMVFNGEIYNFKSLRQGLEGLAITLPHMVTVSRSCIRTKT